MSDKNVVWKDLIVQTPDAEFDTRLVEKKIDDGFMKADAYETHLQKVAEETEFDFSSIDSTEPEELTPSPTT